MSSNFIVHFKIKFISFYKWSFQNKDNYGNKQNILVLSANLYLNTMRITHSKVFKSYMNSILLFIAI